LVRLLHGTYVQHDEVGDGADGQKMMKIRVKF
jgi:hypothetical protein